jgi:hypothetical protein
MQGTTGGACDPVQGLFTTTPACASGMYCQLQYTKTATGCTSDADCSSILFAYCDTASGFCQSPSGGKCEPRTAAGNDCDPNRDGFSSFVNNQCADGSMCMKVGVQTKATCQSQGSVGADCTTDETCKIGLYCKTGKCTAWFADGQGCDTNNHCASATQQSVCIADNADAGAATTCQATKNFGASCTPGFEDPLCEPSDLPGSTYCAPTSTGGSCAPKCF